MDEKSTEKKVFRFSPHPNQAGDIHWREWGEEAFREAKAEDKPVLLAISAVWCHWCHVMDETTYSDQKIIDLINGEYIPIRVDNDQRPDINQRYNMGGWPTAAFLTPQGDVLTGVTYAAPDSFYQISSQVKEYYRWRKPELYAKLLELRQKTAKPRRMQHSSSPLDPSITSQVADLLAKGYDDEYGGFGSAPKFPHTEALELILEEHQAQREGKWAVMAIKTMENMARGGMFDHQEGGFFRYSTDRQWSVPHFEKMLEDNAALLRLYLHGAHVLKPGDFAETARRIIGYVRSTLYDPANGTFLGSQDADEEYYSLSLAERASRVRPYVDPTIYTNWNASMADALLETAGLLSEPELLSMALRDIDFLWEKGFQEGKGLCHYWDGHPHLWGRLTDQAWMLRSLMSAYEGTAKAEYLEKAESLSRILLSTLWDKDAGGFYDMMEDSAPIGNLQHRDKPIIENALAADAYLRLYHLTGEESYKQIAESTLSLFSSDYQGYGLFAAGYARAVRHLLLSPLKIVIVGSSEDNGFTELLGQARGIYRPFRVLIPLDPKRDVARLRKLDYPSSPSPAAYVCFDSVCLEPETDAASLSASMNRLPLVGK